MEKSLFCDWPIIRPPSLFCSLCLSCYALWLNGDKLGQWRVYRSQLGMCVDHFNRYHYWSGGPHNPKLGAHIEGGVIIWHWNYDGCCGVGVHLSNGFKTNRPSILTFGYLDKFEHIICDIQVCNWKKNMPKTCTKLHHLRTLWTRRNADTDVQYKSLPQLWSSPPQPTFDGQVPMWGVSRNNGDGQWYHSILVGI